MLPLPPLPVPFSDNETAWIRKRGGNLRSRKTAKFWMKAAAEFNERFGDCRTALALKAKFIKLVGGTKKAKAREKGNAARLTRME